MKHLAIGIPFRGEIGRLSTTLASLRANTLPTAQSGMGLDNIQAIDVILLIDAPAGAACITPPVSQGLRHLTVPKPGGDAACLNCLIKATPADVLILLQNGAQVGPGWLGYLFAAINDDDCNGIAGPSTNRAATQQAQAIRGGNGTLSIEALARIAKGVGRGYQSQWQVVERLEDFCLAFRRETINAAGEACVESGVYWADDYQTRCARVGFKCVWARGAYVHREFNGVVHTVNKTTATRSIRRAPLILHRPLSTRSRRETRPLPLNSWPLVHGAVSTDGVKDAIIPALISCIMPTRGRPHWVRQSIAYFLRQDYPKRELIIVDDDGVSEETGSYEDARIRRVTMPRGTSIGAKRNFAISISSGEIIAQWDDDDWYSPRRLSAQVAPLLAGDADITGLDAGVWFDVETGDSWKSSEALHRRLFVGNVHGGTLVFRRDVWNRLSRYPDRSLAEDAVFLRAATRRGARLRRLSNDGLFVYVRHSTNTWSVDAGSNLNHNGWHRVPEPDFSDEDRAFYHLSISKRNSDELPNRTSNVVTRDDQPLVTCIMPTADRRHFVTRAIRYFLQQDYEKSELIIVDDGSDPVGDLVPAHEPRIRYLNFSQMNGRRQSVGAKRNIACAAAMGSIIVHWDDDDWSAPNRITRQVACLKDRCSGEIKSFPEVCGLKNIYYYDLTTAQAWQYIWRGSRPWIAGNSMAYLKSRWQRRPFAEINVGEDARFLWAEPFSRITTLPVNDFLVGLIHGGEAGNISPKNPIKSANSPWQLRPVTELKKLLGCEWAVFSAAPTIARSVQVLP